MPASGAQLWDEIESTATPAGSVTLWWLFQAGFVIKSPGGSVVIVDPYLSDAVTRSYGVERGVPAPLQASEAPAGAVLASHSHEDHLDPDSITGFAGHPHTRFIGPPMAMNKVVSAGVDAERTTEIRRGETVAVGDIDIRATFARHMCVPEPTPDAVGYVFTAGGVSIYVSGDTEYDARIIEDTRNVDVSLICMNGTAGNMNVHEAALLAWQQQSRLAIPMHYGLWYDAGYGEGATLDPKVFVDTYTRLKPGGRTHILQPATALALSGSEL